MGSGKRLRKEVQAKRFKQSDGRCDATSEQVGITRTASSWMCLSHSAYLFGLMMLLHHLAGIHDALRVKCLLDRSHELHFYRRFIAHNFLALKLAQAVLGRN